MMWHVAVTYASLLSSRFTDMFDKHRERSFGTSGKDPQWQTCMGSVQDAFGMAVGVLFVDKKFSGESKKSVSCFYSLFCSFIHSLIHSFIHSFVRSFVRSFVDSFDCSFVHLFICSFALSFAPSLVRSFVRSFIRSFVRSLVYSFIDSFLFIHYLSSYMSIFSRPNLNHIYFYFFVLV